MVFPFSYNERIHGSRTESLRACYKQYAVWFSLWARGSGEMIRRAFLRRRTMGGIFGFVQQLLAGFLIILFGLGCSIARIFDPGACDFSGFLF